MNTALPTAKLRERTLLLLTLTLGATATIALFVGPGGFDFELAALRSSRVALALLAGAALGASGSALQALLGNPLADPYVVGVSGGGALGGALAIALGGASWFGAVPVCAMAGAFLCSLLLLVFVSRESRATPHLALLAGVALNAFAGALLTLIKTLLPAQQTQAMIFWLVGSVGYPDTTALVLIAFTVCLGLASLINQSGALELLSLGDDEASRLGVSVRSAKVHLYLALSLLVGVMVAHCGMIGFIGLVTPQILKRWVSPDQRILLPASALFGAILLVIFDAAARLSFAFFDTEIPAGALSALAGAPVFAWMLLRRNPEHAC